MLVEDENMINRFRMVIYVIGVTRRRVTLNALAVENELGGA